MTDQQDGLSCFFVRELFPLRAEGALDQVRKNKIESHLSTCKECKAYYEKLERARVRILSLAGTKVTPEMIAYLKAEHHFWTDSSKRLGWKRWPATLKWSVELSLVTLVLILTVHYFPWIRLAHFVQDMRPAQQVIVAVNTPAPEPILKIVQSTPVPFGPQVKPEATAVAITAPAPTPVIVADNEKKSDDQKEQEEENSQTAGVVPSETDQKMAGFVWRGSLKVDELTDDVALRVTKTIMDLGGTKAGQVELGWHRGKQRYYHFILPEENYEKFLSVLNTEGIVQLTKERHPRTIREGHMRIIMTVEESEE